jgi:hypothetical protein
MEITYIRDGRSVTINPPVKFAAMINRKLEADPAATEKAKRIRDGILKGSP